MDSVVPQGSEVPAGDSAARDREMVGTLLKMSDEEFALFVRLYEATAHVRTSRGTDGEKIREIKQILERDPQLRDAYRALIARGGEAL